MSNIIGRPSHVTYIDSDNDEITCLTEEELSRAIFEENVPKFVSFYTSDSDQMPISSGGKEFDCQNLECETTPQTNKEIRQNMDNCTNTYSETSSSSKDPPTDSDSQTSSAENQHSNNNINDTFLDSCDSQQGSLNDV